MVGAVPLRVGWGRVGFRVRGVALGVGGALVVGAVALRVGWGGVGLRVWGKEKKKTSTIFRQYVI